MIVSLCLSHIHRSTWQALSLQRPGFPRISASFVPVQDIWTILRRFYRDLTSVQVFISIVPAFLCDCSFSFQEGVLFFVLEGKGRRCRPLQTILIRTNKAMSAVMLFRLLLSQTLDYVILLLSVSCEVTQRASMRFYQQSSQLALP